MVETKIRETDLQLTITGAKGSLSETQTTETSIGGHNIDRKIYEPTDDTETTILSIPRYTRPHAVFLLSGLGNKIYKIKNVTSNLTDLQVDEGGEVGFYALASEGSKVLYHLGMYKLMEYLRQVYNSIVISQPKCSRCEGTGLVGVEVCPQCNGYGYDGYNAIRSIQMDKGFDVGLSRNKYDYPLTSDTQHALVKDFVNKVWTQKWWVTPTVSEIKRIFAHFYQVGTDEIYITERFHPSMPQWDIAIPDFKTDACPFNELDQDLMLYLAESITPAGVNVFVTFYEIYYFGNLDDFDCEGPWEHNYQDSIEGWYDNWFSRWMFANGWNEACEIFEQNSTILTGCWTSSGAAVAEPNDRFRHSLMLSGNGAYAERNLSPSCTGCECSGVTGGCVEWWMHPETSTFRATLLDCSGVTGMWIEYNQGLTGFAYGTGASAPTKIYSMMPHSEAHIRVCFDGVTGACAYGEDNGNYPATYSFEGEVGQTGTAISFVDIQTGSSCASVLTEVDEHKEVLKFAPTDGGANEVIKHTFSEERATGTVEFYIRIENAIANLFDLRIYDGAWPHVIRIWIDAENLVELYNGGASVKLGAVTPDTWYHWKIEWDVTVADKYYFWIDGVSQDGGGGYDWVTGGNPVKMDHLELTGVNTNDIVYIDAWGESWDPNYNIGDNLVSEQDCIRHYYNYNANIYVNRELYASGIILPTGIIGRIKFENRTAGTGFVDCLGWDWASGLCADGIETCYSLGQNWQDLYLWGWGINHEDHVSGVSGLYLDYFRKDRPIITVT